MQTGGCGFQGDVGGATQTGGWIEGWIKESTDWQTDATEKERWSLSSGDMEEHCKLKF